MRLPSHALLPALLALAACFWLTGCDPADNRGFTSELNDSNYVRGGQLMRAGRNQEALSAYLKVIDKRGGDAPESHLQAGVLYLQQIKDPVAAIYHFNRFLELKPNSQLADNVKQLIDTGKKDFARTLPAQPFEGRLDREQLVNRVDSLTKENFELKEEIARLRGLPLSQRPAPAPLSQVAEPAADDGDGSVVPVPQNHPQPQPTAPVPSRPAPTTPSRPANQVTNNTAPTTPSGRVHTVQVKETLWSISTQYYGNGRRVNDIVAANRGVLDPANPQLKPGMQLRIP